LPEFPDGQWSWPEEQVNIVEELLAGALLIAAWGRGAAAINCPESAAMFQYTIHKERL
jgi:hypothetical protein